MGGKSIRKDSSNNKFLCVVEIIGGGLLIIGMFTQIVALIFVLILGVALIQKMRHGTFLSDGVNYYLILFVIALSLLFSGAGFFAVDYPL